MRDPDTIEREIAAERDKLVRSLRALDDRVSPEAIVRRATDGLRRPAGDASDLARDNPLALALIGSGVAWLLASATRGSEGDARAAGPASPDTPQFTPTTPVTSRADASGTGPDARSVGIPLATGRLEPKGDSPMSMTGSGLHETDPHFDTQPGKRARLRQSAQDLRDRLYDGIDSLPDAAKARVLETRLKAIEMQSAIEARVARTSDTVRQGANDNPLLVGAIAFGIGAALATALPRTSVENRNLGARRDQLLDEADRMVREETAKLRNVAESAVAEGKEAVKDTLRSGPPKEDDPVERVNKAAKREARHQGVGKVN